MRNLYNLICVFLLLLSCTTEQKDCTLSCQLEICQSKCKKKVVDEEMPVVLNDGIDKKQFFLVGQNLSTSLLKENPSQLNDLRKQAYGLALKKLASTTAGSSAKAIRKALEMEKHIDFTQIANRENSISQIVSVYEHSGYYDCDSCRYNYAITIATPRDKEYLLPEEIRNLVYQFLRLDSELEQIKLGTQATDISINIAQVIINMTTNPTFNEAIRPLFFKYSSTLQYLDPETVFFFEQSSKPNEVINFPPASFHLNIITEMIINDIYDRLGKILLQQPNRQFEITCAGYTDPSRILSSIPYSGAGWSTTRSGQKLSVESLDKKPIAPDITNKVELSYARGFVGYEYLFTKMNRDREAPYMKNVRLNYTGNGVDYSKKNPWQKRRLEFKISIK